MEKITKFTKTILLILFNFYLYHTILLKLIPPKIQNVSEKF